MSLPPSDRFVLSLFSHCREKMEQSKSLRCSYVSVLRGTLFPLRLRCTHQSEPDTVEQLKVRVESTAPLRIRDCCSICDQDTVASEGPKCSSVFSLSVLYCMLQQL